MVIMNFYMKERCNFKMNKMCEIQNIELVSGEVEIRYGLIRFSKEYMDVSDSLFPNAFEFKMGGCFVDPNNPKTRIVEYCNECRKAEKDWLKNNHKYLNQQTSE